MRVLARHGRPLPTVTRVTSAGAPVPPDVVATIRRLLPADAQPLYQDAVTRLGVKGADLRYDFVNVTIPAESSRCGEDAGSRSV
ncbi:hypothetical protein G6F24_017546 [Rhizopus arrhizus]|nr:hypothetical protein G6F24_017546 [Rhizopus arrhizus]